MKFLRVTAVASILAASSALSVAQAPPEIVARMEQEKAARKACKVEICKGFATPTSGPAVSCDMVKSWLREDITSRIVGGSYVWGYGHMKCAFKVNLDRAELAKSRKPEASKAAFGEHVITCDVDDKEPGKGVAFQMKTSLTPVVSFEKGSATAVALEPIKTEGSGAASAAVSSVMALDKVSGFVSKTVTKELNDFLFASCKEEGVTIEPLK